MTKNTILDTRTANFNDLIGNRRLYRVPPYQRDYSWTKKNWEELWEDIITKLYGTDDSHYMGAIVLQNDDSNNSFTIIDGQQRIATLSILAIAIIEKINELIVRDVEAEENSQRQDILKKTYLGNKDPSSLKYSSKLFLNENNDNFYQSRLVNFRPPTNPRSLTKSEKLLWNAYLYFSGQLGGMPNLVDNGSNLASFLTDTVAQNLLFIQINVEDQVNAYIVFETLNSRGVELGATDLLKNYLFSLFQKSDNDLKEAQRQWREIVGTVGMEKFPEFLKYFLSMSGGRVRSKDLYAVTRKRIKKPEKAFELLAQIRDFSELYIALGNPNDDFWLDHSSQQKVREHVRVLNLFKVKQAYPVLFSAYSKFNEQRFEQLLGIIVIISFRDTVVSERSPSRLETQYNTLAASIASGKVKTPKAAFNAISSTLYVADEKFKQDFSLLSISTDKKKEIVRYILRKIEKDIANKDVPEDSFMIEHILPQEPTEAWRQKFNDEDDVEEMIYRLGNMTPLEKSINRPLGRASYEAKQEAYQKSEYVTTKLIQANSWDADSILKRQQEMAQRAMRIWRVNY